MGNLLFFYNSKMAKGVTLPFLSYGGSSLLISMCSMGVILSISRSI